MTPEPTLMIFTDLDGTLIDHDSYDWTPARPALNRLKDIGAAVILASSKTSQEIDQLRRNMALQHWPAIVENGAGRLAPHASPSNDAEDYARIRAALDALPQNLRQAFTGFGDMSEATVSQITGLTLDAAKTAKQRAFSEPGLWKGNAADKALFLDALASQGIRAQQGGRFLTLSFGATKADQLATIIEEYRPRTTIALGDAPNDIEMLTACDFGVVVANPNKDPLQTLKGEAEGRITRTSEPGPVGWNTAIHALLERLDV